MHLNDEEQRGYDARTTREPWGLDYFSGGHDYQHGWDLAAEEERRERANEELRQQERQQEQLMEEEFFNRMAEEHEDQFQRQMQQEMIEHETKTNVKPMKSLQAIFDQVVTHLLTQNEVAWDANGVCQYRGPRGTKCAVGCLIDDANYNADIEGLSINSALRDQHVMARCKQLVDAVINSGVDLNDPATAKLMDRLQQVHDRCSPAIWETRLKIEAKEAGLQFNYAKETCPTS